MDYHAPQDLRSILDLDLPTDGLGKEGLIKMTEQVLRYSVNTWNQGFMDKLYASTNAVSWYRCAVGGLELKPSAGRSCFGAALSCSQHQRKSDSAKGIFS